MLLCFVDESVRGDFHGFAGLIADEHATKSLTASLNKILAQVAVDFGLARTLSCMLTPSFMARTSGRACRHEHE